METNPVVHLSRWSVKPGAGTDIYTAPELATICLHGLVSGHPRHADGTEVTTGTIVSADGRMAHGKRTTYVLGSIDPRYRRWLKKKGMAYNPAAPIVFK
jgi:hypothetical protein